ncbi:3-mercaptopyruvate sulfurtransferase [Pelomyxa schiedti]|nr:3-mercaptopyruvate sulfurtransferase [Pelomyxa schiedti]
MSSASSSSTAATTTTTYLSTGDLAANLGRGSWVVLDVRWIHGDPLKGRADFLESHIEGAVFVHLVEDATGEVVPGVTGRNPLPSLEKANKVFSRAGINPGSTVVVYDSMGGAFAGRVWWILKWLQHDGPVYLLEGGFKKWSREGLPTSSGDEPPKALGTFVGRPCAEMCVGAEEVMAALKEPESWKLIDTRPAERFTGQSEPVDPVAGHIPGFINVPFQQNINTTTGMPLTREELRANWDCGWAVCSFCCALWPWDAQDVPWFVE